MIARAAVRSAASWIGLVAVLIAIVLAWRFLPMRNWILFITDLVRQLGTWGIVVYAVMYVGGVLFLAPAEIMSIAGGLVFGLWAIPLVIVLATLGATFDFLVSRYFLRAKVREFARRRTAFDALDRAVRNEGWKVVLLLRLNPLVPFNLQNYLFGVTDIRLLAYAVATFFGIMPGTAAYMYLGILGGEAAAGKAPGGLKLAFLAAGLVATLALVLFVGWRAKAMLRSFGVERDSRR
jgi:uncharacterized membrane protein YdjX (TVP38/TMEM64 family)